MNTKRSGSAHYITNNSQYGQGWHVHEGQLAVGMQKAQVPTYAEVVKNMQDFRRTEKLMKNRLVAKQFGLTDPSIQKQILTEEERERRKFDTKVPPKPFHVKEGEYKIPANGLNIGSPLYETINMQYGALVPTSFELHEKYYPRNNQFSTQFNEGMYKFDGLNTSVAFSKVHNKLDEF